MPIEFVLAERRAPGQPAAAKKLFAQASSAGETTTRRLAERIAQMSSLSTPDVMGVLEALYQVVPQELAEGRIVRLGDFGSLQVTLQGEGAATEKGFSASLIKTRRVRFREGRGISAALAGAELRRVERAPAAAAKRAAKK